MIDILFNDFVSSASG